MSDDPNKLKTVLLENASTDQQKQFSDMLAHSCAVADMQNRGHKCWLQVPDKTSMAHIMKYSENNTCPKCKKYSLKIQVYHGNFGDSLKFKCWNECDFEEPIDFNLDLI